MNYVIIENTPGYLPENVDPPEFESYAEAMRYLHDYNTELHEEGYKVEPILNGQFSYYRINDDLGRNVEIVPIPAEED